MRFVLPNKQTHAKPLPVTAGDTSDGGAGDALRQTCRTRSFAPRDNYRRVCRSAPVPDTTAAHWDRFTRRDLGLRKRKPRAWPRRAGLTWTERARPC